MLLFPVFFERILACLSHAMKSSISNIGLVEERAKKQGELPNIPSYSTIVSCKNAQPLQLVIHMSDTILSFLDLRFNDHEP